jgi:hypothetical protein
VNAVAAARGFPNDLFPHSNPGCSPHAPDEIMLGCVAKDGLAIMSHLFGSRVSQNR